jgi:hypothetical protein
MRYRRLDENGDYVFGQGSQQFLTNSPQAVAQAVATRLKLYQGEWFIDTSDGMPWMTEVFGAGTETLFDSAIRKRILGTPGVLEITEYRSLRDSARKLSVTCTITTQYGTTQLQQVI